MPGGRTQSLRTARPLLGAAMQKVVAHEDLIRQLSAEERAALEELVHDPPRRAIASRHTYRLLELGLAELWCGRPVLTRAGISAVAVARDL